jgi:hypothetical protein
MSFRRYGGLDYAPKHNIVGSNYNTTNNLSVTQGVGQPNSYINFLSDISGNIRVYGDLDVSGNFNISGDIDVSGNINVSGDLDVSGNEYIGGDLDVSGNIDCSGNVTAFNMFLTSGSNYNTAENGVVPKSYVDLLSSGIRPVPPCVLCENNNPITPLSGYPTIDGVPISSSYNGSAVLINAQGAQGGKNFPNINNGIYIVSSGPWSRADYLENGDKATGVLTNILQGTLANYKFLCTSGTATTPAVIGDPVLWTPYEFNEQLGQGLERVTINNTNYIQVTDNVFNGIIPIGGIIMWSGVVPTNWILCDGSNNTPDLRDRFIVGSGLSYAIGATGGLSTVTLTTGEIPAHNHAVNDPGHAHVASNDYTDKTSQDTGETSYVQQGGLSGISKTGITIGQTGGSGAHENRPPYYALAFIMRIS